MDYHFISSKTSYGPTFKVLINRFKYIFKTIFVIKLWRKLFLFKFVTMLFVKFREIFNVQKFQKVNIDIQIENLPCLTFKLSVLSAVVLYLLHACMFNKCLLTWAAIRKAFLHSGHENGRWPVCVNVWRVRLIRLTNFLSQCEHGYGRSAEWCAFMWAL